MKKRILATAGGVAVLAALSGGGVAIASGGDDEPGSHDYTAAQATRAEKAALEATGGGEANSVEADSENGATYEVEVTRPDGRTVDVRLDESFHVVIIEGDTEDGGNG